MADHTDPVAVLMNNAADPTPATQTPSSSTLPADRPGQIDECTDLSNGQRFAREHAAEVKYSDPEKCWYHWTGKRWERDQTGAAVRMAKATAAGLLADAAKAMERAAGDPAATAAATRLLKWAVASQQSNRIDAMLKLARSEAEIAVTPEMFDANPWLLNCTTHTVDLSNGTAREHRREDLITALCPHPFDPTAACPTWEKFLLDVFDGDAEMVEFVRRLLGYLLTGDVSVHVLVILYGMGSNGKTVLTEVLLALLGVDYATPAPDSLLAGNEDPHPAAVAELKGRRVVVAAETASGGRLQESLVKRLTGGDRLKARRLYGQFFSFEPTHKCLIATNHRPRVKEGGHGIWRRLRLIPFAVRFWSSDRGESGLPHLKADPALKQKLAAEYPGILRWAIAGCAAWIADGRRLTMPDKVAKATQEYRTAEDTFGQFLGERCVRDAAAETSVKNLYPAYLTWCEQANERPVSKRSFGSKLTEAGFSVRPSNGQTLYAGLRLASADQWRSGDQTPYSQTSSTHTRVGEKYGSGVRSPLMPTDRHCGHPETSQPPPVWDDSAAFNNLMGRAGWDWTRLAAWLNSEHSADLPAGAEFDDVLTVHRKAAAEHLARLAQAA